MLAEIDTIFQKQDYKKNLIEFFGSNYGKIVIGLLIKVVIVDVIFSSIYI